LVRTLLPALLLALVFAVGCNKSATPRTDSQVTADIQNKINSDANLPNKQIAVGSSNGVVTLTGTVSSENERLAAANDASTVDGVKTVVNNLVVAPAQNGMADNTPSPEPTRRRATATKSSGNRVRTAPIAENTAPMQDTTPVAAATPPPYTPP